VLNNAQAFKVKDTGGNARIIGYVDASNITHLAAYPYGNINIGYGGSGNPVHIFVGGGMKRVEIDGSGFLKGVAV
jgi:hypothetical protein